MDEKLRLSTLDILGPPEYVPAVSMAFMREMYAVYATELDALVGRSALDRPYNERQPTIAERFFRDELGRDALLAEDLMEVNRTVMNIANGRALLDPDSERSYRFITDCQKIPAIKLRKERHLWLSSFAKHVMRTPERQRTMETGLMGADMGKSEPIHKYMEQKYGRRYADHDHLLVDLMANPVDLQHWMPAHYNLPVPSQLTILANYQSGYHVPQSFQAESLPIHLEKFLQMSEDNQDFGLLLGLLDISGAEGDRVQNGSVTLNEPVVAAFQMLVEAVHSRPKHLPATEQALFVERAYLRQRAAQWGLDIDQPGGRELARLGCLLRFSQPEQLENIVHIMDTRLEHQDHHDLLELLSYTGFEASGHVWIMYLPDLIRRYSEKLQAAQVPKEQAWDIALTLAARTYRAAKEQIDLRPGVVVVAGDLVRTFEKDPRIPLTHRIRITAVDEREANATFEAV